MREQSEARTGRCPVPGGQIAYEVAGSGPAVVLIHAGIADRRMWDPQVAALAPSHTVVRYDCRGFGETTSEPVAYADRQDVADLLDHLGIARAAVVGCSRGGQIALDFALERPGRVSALGWVCSGVGGWEAPDELFIPEEDALWERIVAAERAGDWPQVAALEVRFWVDGSRQPEGRAAEPVRRKVYEMALSSYLNAQVPELKPQPLDPPAVGRLSELAAPVLAIVGDLDLPSTAASAEVLAAGAPDVRVEHFADAAHLPSMERPERFNALLLEFLARHGA